MVKTTYSNCNSEDEYEFDDLDAPDFPENAGTYEEHEDLDLNHGDDLEYSLNKMSITPKSAFQHPINTNFHQPSLMPARIRPSVTAIDTASPRLLLDLQSSALAATHLLAPQLLSAIVVELSNFDLPYYFNSPMTDSGVGSAELC
ncbi:hypothetical protein B296_00020892 [Ensete ventricosum]|uniref:Uncharacterized protein n=1 Tax=Ensete ventricosum TaxID=4639 RepID=A0A427AMB8_ENSVE|nr:hypothetical protein B296_00020892 [Ensete ventricosum]